MQVLDRELLLTVCYSAQFSYPLTISELVLRRLSLRRPRTSLHRGPTKTSTTQVTQDTPGQIFTSILSLIDAGLLVYQRGYLCLPGREEDIVVRVRRTQSTEQKFLEIQPLLRFLRKVPGIAGVAVTGSAAVGNAEADDDVDFMIVTNNERLWLLRPLIVFFALLYGKRRTWQREEKNSWCFNLWLERRSLQQPVSARSLYVAHEVCQAQWLLDNGGCKDEFLASNAWVARYLPSYYSWRKVAAVPYQDMRHQSPYRPILSELATAANWVLYFLQRIYMRPHMTRERVAPGFAFFHPRDTGFIIQRNYRDIVNELFSNEFHE